MDTDKSQFEMCLPMPRISSPKGKQASGETEQRLDAENLCSSVFIRGFALCAAEVVTNPPGSAATNVAAQKVTTNATRVINPLTGFVAGSLPDIVWGGFHTNGRSTNMWEFSQLPLGWPLRPPVLRWNTNNLMWGRKGMTAICQVWEDMGSFGQVSITALTRRHGYLRGHHMGPSGLDPRKVGHRVWFCTRDNQVVERRLQLLFIRGQDVRGQPDYSIVLFDADLPPGIEPMRVADSLKLTMKYLIGDRSRRPLLTSLQGGVVSAGIPGWTIPERGGDSGAPIMLPLPGELVFFMGQTTSAASAGMQADMDMLSRKAGLDPRKYQMQWVDLDSYPNLWPY